MLYLKLFGGFQLLVDGQPLPVTKPRQREILTYLALRYPASVTRQSLAAQLWPESNDSQAMTNLRGHLLKLREEIPQLERYLCFEGSDLTWRDDAKVASDVWEFKQYLQNAAQSSDDEFIHATLEKAEALNEGALYPDCFAEWIVEDRERLRDQFVHLLERLGVLHESMRQYKDAVIYVRRLLRFEPQREEGYRLLMRLHAMLGELDEVRRVYQQCERVLKEEFGAPPSAPTRDLYERLLQSGEHVSEMPQARVPMVGRTAQWHRLQKCWGTVLSRGAHVVLIEGEVGIGKSRLLEEMVASVQRHGFAVMSVACSYLHARLSYAPLVQWLHSETLRSQLRSLDNHRRAELAQLLPELALDGDNNRPLALSLSGLQRTHLHQTLAQLFLARQSPLLLVIDNLHWCDADTLDWLHLLLTHDPHAPIMLLTATCPAYPAQTPLAGWRATVRQQGILTEIKLPALTLDETRQLAERSTEDLITSDEALLLHRLGSGNPAHMLDLLNSQSKLPVRLAQRIEQTQHAVFDLLLAHLPNHALEVVECAVMLDSTFTLAQFFQANFPDVEALLLALGLLVDSCILRELGDDAYCFTSQLLPRLVLERMNRTRQQYWNLRLGRVGQ